MEWKLELIQSGNKDKSHSCVRISHGLNKLVRDLIDKEHDDNELETSETKTEAFALKTDVFSIASRSKAKAKPRRPTSARSSTRSVPRERIWTDIEPGAQSNQAYPVAKRLNTLLRHGQLPQEDGAIEFWTMKDCLRNEFERSQHWSYEKWKSTMAGGVGNKKRFQYCTGSSGQEILYLRALQGHSGRNPIDLTLQDNVLIDSNHNNTEVPADPHEEQVPQTSIKVLAARSKAQAKPQKRETVELPNNIPMNERKWIDIDPAEPLSLRPRSRRK